MKLRPLILLFLTALTLQECRSHIRCYKKSCSHFFIYAPSAAHCCIDLEGHFYDHGGTAEACHECKVVGWKHTAVYAMEGSTVNLTFGYTKGRPIAKNTFDIAISGNGSENIHPVSSLTNIDLLWFDIHVILNISHQPMLPTRGHKSVVLELIPMYNDHYDFFYPKEMTLYIEVPRVQFESGYYEFDSFEAAIVCVRYDSTPSDFNLEFEVGIAITSNTGVDTKKKLRFTGDDQVACLNISFLSQELDERKGGEFSIAIVVMPEFFVKIGPVASANVTILGSDNSTAESGSTPENLIENESADGESYITQKSSDSAQISSPTNQVKRGSSHLTTVTIAALAAVIIAVLVLVIVVSLICVMIYQSGTAKL